MEPRQQRRHAGATLYRPVATLFRLGATLYRRVATLCRLGDGECDSGPERDVPGHCRGQR